MRVSKYADGEEQNTNNIDAKKEKILRPLIFVHRDKGKAYSRDAHNAQGATPKKKCITSIITI